MLGEPNGSMDNDGVVRSRLLKEESSDSNLFDTSASRVVSCLMDFGGLVNQNNDPRQLFLSGLVAEEKLQS